MQSFQLHSYGQPRGLNPHCKLIQLIKFFNFLGGKRFVAFIWLLLVSLFKGGKGVGFGITFSCLDEFLEFGIVAPLPIAFLLLGDSFSEERHVAKLCALHCYVIE